MINFTIMDEMIQKAKDFAERKQPTSYPRFGESKEEQIKRLYSGKLGELIGQEALMKVGIPHQCLGKLEVVEEMGYRDTADCIIFPGIDKEESVDFKTAWKPFHVRILVPEDMFLSQKKDIYIGVKINLQEKIARVYGYATREFMRTAHPVTDFGEGPAYWVYLKELKPLDELKDL